MRLLLLFYLVLSKGLYARDTFPKFEHWQFANIVDVQEALNREAFRDLEGPPLVWLPVLKIGMDIGEEKFKECLYYRRDRDGQIFLKLMNLPAGKDCLDVVTQEEHLIWGPFSRVRFSYLDQQLRFQISTTEKTKRVNIALFNKNNFELKKERVLSGNELVGRYGILVYKGTMIAEKKENRIGHYCRQVDASCEVKNLYSCHLCQGVLEFHLTENLYCEKGMDIYCGQLHCGSRDGPACFYGQKNLNQVPKNKFCEQVKSFSFCNRGLEPECVDGKILCR